MQDKLTEKEYWEDYWKKIELPLEVKRENSSPNILAELDIFERFLPKEKLSVLEIGGAPGQYLVYFHKNFSYSPRCLDYSAIGCEKTRDNFKLLNISAEVFNGDLFSKDTKILLSDVVCSFGFVEHFSNLNGVVAEHLKLLKPGGILVIGVPNMLGINHWFLKRLAPKLLAGHNLNTMNSNNWKSFEQEFKLKVLFKNYVGGFEPGVFLKQEKKSFVNNLLFLIARILNKIFHNNFKFLRKFNSKNTSGYLMGIYKKPE